MKKRLFGLPGLIAVLALSVFQIGLSGAAADGAGQGQPANQSDPAAAAQQVSQALPNAHFQS
ncbi:MAG: hypothetical protein ACRDHL_15050 [Candidatus Promineifilaceae bacterium]